MKKTLLLFVVLFGFISLNAQDNPFAELGYEPKIATLSNGQFNESFDNDTIVQIGSVLFNTKSKQIVAFVVTDTMYSEATLEPDIVSRWISPDPLADHPMQIGKSPYQYAWNNPVYWTDPDGRCPFCPWLDAVVDVGFIIYDVGVLATDYISTGETQGEDWAALTADVASIAIPMTVGAGMAARATYKGVKTLNKVDNAVDVAKTVDNVTDAASGVNKGSDVSKGADFVVSPDGNVAATSQSRMKKSFDDAGLPKKNTESPGTEYTMPDGNSVRTMEPSGTNQRRAVFQNKNGQPVNQDFKTVNPPKDLTKPQKKEYVRERTHLPQKK
ncbi:MAG: hypothetical protein JEZ03_17490 [Bacteroidales bacterium]|nr:hypothetical protein [Bacteroidales bacterium]